MPTPLLSRGLLLLLCFASLPARLLADEANPARRAQLDQEALAKVGDRVITVDAFRAELARREARSGLPPESPQVLEQILDEMVRREALLARAKAAGFADRAELIEVFEQLLIKAYLRETLEQRFAAIAISDQEVEDRYQQNAADYAVPARLQAAMVFYEVAGAAPAEERAAVEAKARAALAEAATLPAGIRHFGEIARRDSADRASRYQGGVIGWLTLAPGGIPSAWPAAVGEAVERLTAPGEIGPLIATPQGFYLVRLVERQEARSQPLQQVAAGIRHALMNEKRQQIEAAFDAEMRAELGVSTNLERLRSLAIPTGKIRPPAMPALAATPGPESTSTETAGGSR